MGSIRCPAIPVLAAALGLLSAAAAHAQSHFRRGDANHDARINLADGVGTLGHLFLGLAEPPCADAADFDDDGSLGIDDALGIFRFLFLGGSPPAAPFPVFEADPTPDGLSCKPRIEALQGPIERDRTLTSDRTYRLVSGVAVAEGATLTIEPGTTVLGDSATRGRLCVAGGARLVAAGSPAAPVVFTSDRPAGSRRHGDWGGVVLLGRGDAGNAYLEGGFGPCFLYGGGSDFDPADDSGVLNCVRIEYAGALASENNEMNGLGLMAVGSGTRIERVQVKDCLDDGIEFGGGFCDLKRILVLRPSDHAFQITDNWSGRGQFWVALGGPADGNGCLLLLPSVVERRPPLPGRLSNLSFLGGSGADQMGLEFRSGGGALLFNSLIGGLAVGLVVRDCLTACQFPELLTVESSCFFANGRHFGEQVFVGFCTPSCPSGSPLRLHSVAQFSGLGNCRLDSAPLRDPFHPTRPDLRPLPGALPLGPSFDQRVLDPAFFEPVDHLGAVPPEGAGHDWTQEPWISYAPD